MNDIDFISWQTLENWSPQLFLVAGGILVVFAGLQAAPTFGGASYAGLAAIVGPAGLALGLLALLGQYPRLADASPALARNGAVLAAIGAAGFAVAFLVAVVEAAAGVAPPAWFEIVNIPILVGVILGFLTMGAASLRSATQAQALGALMLAPGILFMVLFILGAIFDRSGGSYIISGGNALVHLAIGYLLWTESRPAEQRERPLESPAT
jgi:hypothetical protein